MTFPELETACKAAIERNLGGMVIATKKAGQPFPRGYGFPRGELLCIGTNGRYVWRVNPKKILTALRRFAKNAVPCYQHDSFHMECSSCVEMNRI